jgi:hypothetical protein
MNRHTPSSPLFFRVMMAVIAAVISFQSMSTAHAQGEVSLSITLDAASSEVISGWRRAHGLDAPDPEADRRLAELASQKQGRAHAISARSPGSVLLRSALSDPRPPQLRLLAASDAH